MLTVLKIHFKIPGLNYITKKEKYEKEYACVKRIAEQYEMPEILELWKEFEENITPEAQFVKKLDKFFAQFAIS